MFARLAPWVVSSIAASIGATGCIVSFNDAPPPSCDGGACREGSVSVPDSAIDRRAPGPDAGPDVVDAAEEPASCKGTADGGYCGPGDPCHDAPTCVAGACTPHVRMNGTPCGIPLDACHSIPACTDGTCGTSMPLADGTQWKSGDDNAHCCQGKEIETTTHDDCGLCGIACKASETCIQIDTHWYCSCSTNAECWSGCCSLTSTGHCSPSDCCTGSCAIPNVCPDGAHCQSDVVNYCSY